MGVKIQTPLIPDVPSSFRRHLGNGSGGRRRGQPGGGEGVWQPVVEGGGRRRTAQTCSVEQRVGSPQPGNAPALLAQRRHHGGRWRRVVVGERGGAHRGGGGRRRRVVGGRSGGAQSTARTGVPGLRRTLQRD